MTSAAKCGRPGSTVGAKDDAGRLPITLVEKYLQSLVATSLIDGAAIALRLDGVRHHIAVGERNASGAQMRLSSRFAIGCLNKPLLAAAGLSLVAEERLDLEAPVANYLPELKRTDKGERILVRHLMSHSAGYAGIRFMDGACLRFDWDDFARFLQGTPQLFEPGAVFNYELSAAVVFGRILERITGQCSAELIEERVLGVLDAEEADSEVGDRASHSGNLVRAKSREDSKVGLPNPLWSASVSRRTVSIRELLTLGEAFLTDAPGTSPSLTMLDLSRMLVTDVPVPRLHGGLQSDCLPVGWGLGMAEFPHDVRGHDGLGRRMSVGLRLSRAEGFVLAIGVWAKSGLIRQRDIIAALLSEIGVQSPLDAQPALPLGFDPGEIAGTYLGSRGCEARVERRGEQLGIEVTMCSPTPARFTGRVTADERYIIDSRPSSAGLGFFPDPVDGRPCLMCADQAFRRAP